MGTFRHSKFFFDFSEVNTYCQIKGVKQRNELLNLSFFTKLKLSVCFGT